MLLGAPRHVSIIADTATPVKGQKISLHICSRFHFSSSLRRMSTVSSLTSPSQTSPTYIACVKGAPEIIKTMVMKSPFRVHYWQTFFSFKTFLIIMIVCILNLLDVAPEYWL